MREAPVIEDLDSDEFEVETGNVPVQLMSTVMDAAIPLRVASMSRNWSFLWQYFPHSSLRTQS